jgi:beta-glucanase (GH16 family)
VRCLIPKVSAPLSVSKLANSNSRRLTGLAVLFALMFGFLAVSPEPGLAATSSRVTFSANGGYGSMSSQLVPRTGANLKKNTFKRTGYRFIGWAKSPQGVMVYKDSARIRPLTALKLYAKWLKIAAAPAPKPTVTGHTVGDFLWSDEFKGAAGGSLNSAVWTSRFCGHDGTNGGGTCHNNEPQWYYPGANKLDGSAQGNLVITTDRTDVAPEGATCLASSCQFKSGRFDTQGKVSFKYGYIEARIKMPRGGTNWPAYWMLGDKMSTAGWPVAGEIDIAEQGGHQPWRNSAAVHYATANEPGACCGNHVYQYGEEVSDVDYSADFHTYGLGWLPDRLEFYADGTMFWWLDREDIGANYWAFNDYFFVIFDNATGAFGGAWDGWVQSKMYIDYVRAWQLDGQGAVVKH